MSAAPPPGPDASRGPRGRRAGLTARFLVAVGEETGAEPLTPDVLARAVVRVLPVDAAGLSVLSPALRVPLGASSVDAERAEVLQTSLGEGPCLDAAHLQAPVALELDELAARWPVYTAELTRQTPFRAVAAVPLRIPAQDAYAALDLFVTAPRFRTPLVLSELDQQVGAPTAALLTTCVAQGLVLGAAGSASSWSSTPAGRRHHVWVAIGMVMAAQPKPARDALSLLRARARALDLSLDDLADELTSRRLPLSDVT